MAASALTIVERVQGTAVMRFEIDVATGYYDMRDPPPFDADAFFSVHHPSHEPDEPPPAPRNLLLEEGEDANAGPIRRRGSGGVGSEGDVSDGHEAADEKRSPDLFSRLAAGEKRRQQPKTPEVRKETVPRQAEKRARQKSDSKDEEDMAAKMEAHNKRIAQAGQLAAKQRVAQSRGTSAAAAPSRPAKPVAEPKGASKTTGPRSAAPQPASARAGSSKPAAQPKSSAPKRKGATHAMAPSAEFLAAHVELESRTSGKGGVAFGAETPVETLPEAAPAPPTSRKSGEARKSSEARKSGEAGPQGARPPSAASAPSAPSRLS